MKRAAQGLLAVTLALVGLALFAPRCASAGTATWKWSPVVLGPGWTLERYALKYAYGADPGSDPTAVLVSVAPAPTQVRQLVSGLPPGRVCGVVATTGKFDGKLYTGNNSGPPACKTITAPAGPVAQFTAAYAFTQVASGGWFLRQVPGKSVAVGAACTAVPGMDHESWGMVGGYIGMCATPED